eukprot:6227699-Prymnesium_polylepis.2
MPYDWLRAVCPRAMSFWMSRSRKTPPNAIVTPMHAQTTGGRPRVIPDCAPTTENAARASDSIANMA